MTPPFSELAAAARATDLGVLLGLAWQGAALFAVIWIVMAFLFRYSSLAALIAAVIVPLGLYFAGDVMVATAFAAMSIIVILKHRANIERLIARTESKIGSK